MWYVDIVLALVVAAVMTAVFLGVSRRWAWRLAIVLFLAVMLGAWAGGLWIRPAGPSLYGIFWLPPVFIGVLVALLLVTSYQEPRKNQPDDGGETVALVSDDRSDSRWPVPLELESTAGVILILFLLIAVLLGYAV